LNIIDLDLPFYHRYVDDIVLAAPEIKVSQILNIFNSFHERIQFTVELEDNRLSFCLSFLDMLLKVDNKNKILVD